MDTRADHATTARRLCRLRALVGALALVVGSAFGAEPPVLSSTQIQAAFVYNFTKFVEWPAQTFRSRTQPLVIGVLGEGPLAAELATIVEGRTVNGRPIVVRSISADGDIGTTQLLFVGETQDERFAAIEVGIREMPILTVGESPEFAAAGGAFRFLEQDGKLRFEINMTAVEHSGLKVSGQLQKLATSLRRSP
jgi:hypothetical protein